MFMNLKIEMLKLGITNKDISKEIETSTKTTYNKLNGFSEFTRKEMYTIRDKFFKDKTIEYLFETSENCSSGRINVHKN